MTKQCFLVMLLRRRKLWYSVWYRRKHPIGWMMGAHDSSGHYDRLGCNFFQAVELIASGALDFLKDAEDNKPTHISVALEEPE